MASAYISWPFFFFHLTLYLRVFHGITYPLKIDFLLLHKLSASGFIIVYYYLFLLFGCANGMCYWMINGNRAMGIGEVIDKQPLWRPHWSHV